MVAQFAALRRTKRDGVRTSPWQDRSDVIEPPRTTLECWRAFKKRWDTEFEAGAAHTVYAGSCMMTCKHARKSITLHNRTARNAAEHSTPRTQPITVLSAFRLLNNGAVSLSQGMLPRARPRVGSKRRTLKQCVSGDIAV